MRSYKETKTTFSELINEKINEGMPHANRTIVNSLANKNITISMRSLQSYRKGERIPSFLIAKEILKVLKVDMDDDDLLSILNSSRNLPSDTGAEKSYSSFERKDEKQSSLKRIATLNIEDLDIDADTGIKAQILNDRIVELYGDEREFGEYIKELIEYDLENEILKGGE